MSKKIIAGTSVGMVLGMGIVSGVPDVGSNLNVGNTNILPKPLEAKAVENPTENEYLEFKDKVFEQQIRSKLKIPEGEGITQAKIDTETSVTINDYAIKDLSDLKYFTNMNTLTIGKTQATELNLNVSASKLVNFRVDSNSYVENINLGDVPKMITMELANTKVKNVSVGINNLPSLAINGTKDLESLSIGKSTNLTKIDSVNSGIKKLSISGENKYLKNIKLKDMPRLTTFPTADLEGLTSLEIDNVGIHNLDISDRFINLVYLTVSNVDNFRYDLGRKPSLASFDFKNVEMAMDIDFEKQGISGITSLSLDNVYGVETATNKPRVIKTGDESVLIRPTINLKLGDKITVSNLFVTNSDIETLDLNTQDTESRAVLRKLDLDGSYIKDMINTRGYSMLIESDSAKPEKLWLKNSRMEKLSQLLEMARHNSWKSNMESEITVSNYRLGKVNLKEGMKFDDKLISFSVLNSPNVTDIDLGNYKNLATVNYSDLPNVTELPNNQGKLNSVTKLTVNNTGLKNLDFLEGAEKLEEVSLKSNYLTNFEGLKDMKNLKNVFLSDNLITSVPNYVKSGNYVLKYNQLSQLEGLNVLNGRLIGSNYNIGNYASDLLAGNYFKDISITGKVFTDATGTYTFSPKGTAEKYDYTTASNDFNGYVFNYSKAGDNSKYDNEKAFMGLKPSDINSVESGKTSPLNHEISVPTTNIDYPEFGKGKATKEYVAKRTWEKIQKLDDFYVDSKLGKVTNVQFKNGEITYDYIAPQTKVDVTDEIIIQLFKGYSIKQEVSVKGSDKTMKPNINYNAKGNLVGQVGKNSTIRIHDAFGKVLKEVQADSTGSLEIDMSEFDVNSKTFLITAQDEGFEQSPSVQVLFKDTFAPELTIKYDSSTDNVGEDYALIKVDAKDNVELKSVDWVKGERTVNNYDDATLIKNGKFQVTNNGIYTVRATDTNGNSTLKYVTVDGLKEELAKKPIITSNLTKDNKSATITIKDESSVTKDNIIKYRINGEEWQTYTTPFKMVQNGKIESKILDKKGIETKITTFNVNDINIGYVIKPEMNKIDSKNYTFKTLEGLEYTIKNKTQDYVIKGGVVNDSGIIQLKLNEPVKNGDVIQLEVKDSFDNKDVTEFVYEADETENNDKHHVKVVLPYDIKVQANNTIIEGKGTPNSTVVLYNQKGQTVKTTEVNSSGNFIIKLAENPMQKMELQGISSTGYRTDKVKLDMSYSIEDITVNKDTSSITGSGTPNNTVTIESEDGTVLSKEPVIIDSEGNFTIDVTDKMKEEGSLVIIYTDNNGVEQNRQDIYFGDDFTTPKISENGQALLGSSQKEGYIKVMLGNEVIGVGHTDGGNYNVVLTQPLTHGEKITYIIKDEADAVLKTDEIEYIDNTKFEEAKPLFNQTGSEIYGKSKPNTKYTILDKNEQEIASGKVTKQGFYSHELEEAVQDNEVRIVKVQDLNSKVISYDMIKYKETVISEADLKKPSYDDSSNVISGVVQPSDKVIYEDAEGNKTTITPDVNGKYEIVLDKPIGKDETIKVTVEDKKGETKEDSNIVYKNDIKYVETLNKVKSELNVDVITEDLKEVHTLKGSHDNKTTIALGDKTSDSNVVITENGTHTITVTDSKNNTYNKKLKVSQIVEQDNGGTSKPDGENPSKPDGENPSKPDGENPSKPDGENPSKPDGENPSKPDGENPSKPDVDNPSKPDVDNPSKPDVDNPSKPDGEKPSKPDVDNPSKPDGEKPSKPDVDNPSKPDGEKPSKPDVDNPSKPDVDANNNNEDLDSNNNGNNNNNTSKPNNDVNNNTNSTNQPTKDNPNISDAEEDNLPKTGQDDNKIPFGMGFVATILGLLFLRKSK